MNPATKEYLIKLGNPYAKLSIVDEESPVWRNIGEFHLFLGECFSMQQFRNNPPPVFRQMAKEAIKLSPRAQMHLHHRISSRTPDFIIAHNRLAPKELTAVAAQVREMLDEAKALDVSTD